MTMTGQERSGAGLALGAAGLVGASVAAAGRLHDFPLIGGQAVRYTLATLFLLGWARIRRHTFVRPTRTQLVWIVLLAVMGMAGYGVVLVYATSLTAPGNVGIAIGAAPLVIVLVRSLLTRTRPSRTLIGGALCVALGSALAQLSTQGGVQWSGQGFVWSFLALAGVASVTLLGAPPTQELGSLTVTTYACGLASVTLFAAASITRVVKGTPVLRIPTAVEFSALAFLALGVTTAVFLLWYGAIERLGASRTGLFNGLVPFASLVALYVTGSGTATVNQLAGAALVLFGVACSWAKRDHGGSEPRRRVMPSNASEYDPGMYARTPSQAEGERDDAGERTTEQHPDVARTEPSQAEGERTDDV
ncbi:DMT family transporter [Streptomyces sp. NPDC051954]|uniref:DMT family transporter n=1 Tax=unclassified Streptomyces TaxID=2593676 RepID=UPI0034491BAE